MLFKLGQMLNDEKGEEYIKKAFDKWKIKYENDAMTRSDYAWFESCAMRLGKYDLAEEINKSKLEQSDFRFYNEKNLMSDNFKGEE